MRDQLTPLGLTVSFLDCWEEYHVNLGEVHCATNTLRAATGPLVEVRPMSAEDEAVFRAAVDSEGDDYLAAEQALLTSESSTEAVRAALAEDDPIAQPWLGSSSTPPRRTRRTPRSSPARKPTSP